MFTRIQYTVDVIFYEEQQSIWDVDNEIRVSNSTKTASWQNGGREKKKGQINRKQLDINWCTRHYLHSFGFCGISFDTCWVISIWDRRYTVFVIMYSIIIIEKIEDARSGLNSELIKKRSLTINNLLNELSTASLQFSTG